MKLCLVAVLALAGCSSLSPGTVQAGVASVETAICILNIASKDAGKPAGQVVADAIQACATDAATIARVLDAHHALELREQAADAGAE